MGLLSKVKSTKTEKEEDRVGGFQALASDVYDAIIERMYAFKTDSGTLAVVVEAELFTDPESDDTRRYSQTLYVTNQDGENFYTDSKNKKRLNSSWVIADAIAAFSTDGEAALDSLNVEPLTIKLKRNGKEVNEEVECFPEVEGIECKFAILKVIKPRQQQVDNKWVDVPGETVEANEINRVFNAEGFTLNEWDAEMEEPQFMAKWLAQWKGKPKTVKAKAVEPTKRTGGQGRTASARTPSRTTNRPSRFERK